MKKYIPIITVIVLIVVSVVFINNTPEKVSLSSDEAHIKYEYQDKVISCNVSNDESDIILKAFDGKILVKDSPSCGFTEDVCIMFGDKMFYLACDGCPIIKHNEKYFTVSSSEIDEIHQIFKGYGGTFPCI